MKKLFLVLMMVSLVALLAVPAMAERGCDDCNVSVNADVFKRASYYECVSIHKDFDLRVDGKFNATQWAQATISQCQDNHGNEFVATGIQGRPASTETSSFSGSGKYSGTVTGDVKGDIKGYVQDPDHKDHRSYCDPRKDNDKSKLEAKLDADIVNGKESGTFSFTGTDVTTKSAIPTIYFVSADTIDGSFNRGFTGIAQVNQSSGSGNNQGNELAAAVTDPGSKKDWGHDSKSLSFGKDPRREQAVDGGVAHTEVAVGQKNYDNEVVATAALFNDKISNSFNDFRGVAQVNQAAGFANNQKNAVAIAANIKEGAVAMSDAFLTQTNTRNCAAYVGDVQILANVNSSFNGATGLAQVNQSPGSMNNQANVVAVSYAGFNTSNGGR